MASRRRRVAPEQVLVCQGYRVEVHYIHPEGQGGPNILEVSSIAPGLMVKISTKRRAVFSSLLESTFPVMSTPAELNPERFDQHLSQITTTWTVLFDAHAGSAETISEAQRRLIDRYSPAIYRYLLGAVRNMDTADELFQEFALRFVRGDFRRADPQRGRFRDFVKTALYHLIVDHQRRQGKRPTSIDAAGAEPATEETMTDTADREFLAICRAELMNRTWQALAQYDQQAGQQHFTVLRFRTDHPEVKAPQMAEQLAAALGKTLTPEAIRKKLFLAREKFTDFLVAEVAQTLENDTPEELEQELIDLRLLEYCRAALGRRR